MLSIQPLKSASAAADYYVAAFNYYAGDAEALTWLGKGAAFLNLSGDVKKDVMLQLLEGKVPNGQVLKNREGEHRPGFDMTFSAPKSVSLLVGLDADPELVRFHDNAVKFAVGKIEEEFAEARVSRNGEIQFEKTNNLVVASFRQPSSRANDPALHTHCVVMNMTMHEGRARSLASDPKRLNGVVEQIQNNAHYCGLYYRQHLANSLKEEGYRLRLTGDGLFEIEGVPEEVLRDFSKRREEIEQLLDEKGWSGAKSASAATLLTRSLKEEHDITVLKTSWKERANELNFDAASFVRNREERTPSFLSQVREKIQRWISFNPSEECDELKNARACVHVAIETLSQKTSVFSERALKFESMKHGLVHEKPIREDAVSRAIESEKKKENLYEARSETTNQPMLTTPWLLTLEAESIARIEANKGSVRAITTSKDVQDFQKSQDKVRPYPLTTSQKEAMQAILTTQDRYIAIQGYAGVAKTSMLSEARLLIEQRGFTLRGVTVASSAANELQTKAHIHSDVFPVVHQELKKASAGSLNKLVLIVDESSMLSSQQGHELMKHIERTKARLILVGDKAQLPSVNSGRLFGLLQDYGINTSVMDEIVRQKNPQALEAVVHATKGEAADAIKKLEHVEVQETHEKRVQWIAKHWLSLTEEKRKDTLLFAPTHKNREEITTLLRQGLEKEGALKGESFNQVTLRPKSIEAIHLRFVAYYQKGDVLRFNADVPKNNIKSGDYYQVGQITPEHRNKNVLPFINESGKTRLFALKNLPQYKTHTSSFERFIEVYQTKPISLKEGETLLWGRNFKQDAIRNGERTTLSKITDTTLIFKNRDGKEIELPKNHAALKHLDYGYVLTNHKVQGKDALYGIGLMESYHKFSATLNNFYVQISRAVIGITLVTDNKERLASAISQNSGEKEAALDAISSQRLIQHEERFREQSKVNLKPVTLRKIERDLHQNSHVNEAVFDLKTTASPQKNYQSSNSTLQNPQPIPVKEKFRELEL